jgi:polysaccharide export outer membrane protein
MPTVNKNISRCAVILSVLGICSLPILADRLTPYVLGPNDQITIRAMDAEEISDKPTAIDSTGIINLPMIGRIKAMGLTVRELELAVSERLKAYVLEPKVSITVSEYHSQPVTVIGAVNTPGIQQLRGQKTLVEVLSMCGGLRPDAGYKITVQRKLAYGPIPLPGARNDPSGKFSLAEVSIPSLMRNADPRDNITLEPEDVLTVPRADLVYVLGEVKKSGGFTLQEQESLSLLQALSLAEGMLGTAAAGNARILKARPNGGRQEIAVDLRKTMAGNGPDVQLHPGDVLFIPNSMSKKIAIRGLEAAIQLGTGILIWRR